MNIPLSYNLSNMKKLLFIFLAIGFLGLPSLAFAQEEITTVEEETETVSVPIRPDSPFYFLTSIAENIELFLTFDEGGKLDKELKFADRRVAEMNVIAEDGDTALLEKLQAKYEKHIQNAEKIAAKNQERETEMVQKITEAQEKHLRVLKDVAEKVPLKAKESIDRVIEDTQNKFNNSNTDNNQSDNTGSSNDDTGNGNDSNGSSGNDSSSNGSSGENAVGGNS